MLEAEKRIIFHQLFSKQTCGKIYEQIEFGARKKLKEEVDTLNSADAMIFQTESQLKEYGDKLSDDKKKAIESMQKAAEVIKNGTSVAIAPEGTRSGSKGISSKKTENRV